MSRVLLIDNYDSFTYNLVQAFAVLGAEVIVHRNDALTADEAEDLCPTHLVISPGPGRPEQAGMSVTLLRRFMRRIPVLGVCLGHQAIVAALGGAVVPARSLVHGKASEIYHDGRTLYAGIPSPFRAGRYHSLAVASGSLPAELVPCAHSADGEIMGIRHRRLPVEGVQFHPESVLTPDGNRLLGNFLSAMVLREDLR